MPSPAKQNLLCEHDDGKNVKHRILKLTIRAKQLAKKWQLSLTESEFRIRDYSSEKIWCKRGECILA